MSKEFSNYPPTSTLQGTVKGNGGRDNVAGVEARQELEIERILPPWE
jgi:hypothetical protein